MFEIPRETHDEIRGLWRGVGIDTPEGLLPGPTQVSKVELGLRRLAPTLDVAAALLAGVACCASAPIVAAVAAFLFLLSVHVERWSNELADFLTKE